MEKVDLTKQFAYRLRDTLIAAGYNSERSASGVNIHKLVELTGYSAQICRKYLRGQAIPEAAKLAEISAKLQVSPGWLLFGDNDEDHNTSSNTITISKHLLRYIFQHANELYNHEPNSDEVAQFLLDLVNDISQINTTEEQSKKIIDLALSSARHFQPHGRKKIS